jgi:hypothetical protein
MTPEVFLRGTWQYIVPVYLREAIIALGGIPFSVDHFRLDLWFFAKGTNSYRVTRSEQIKKTTHPSISNILLAKKYFYVVLGYWRVGERIPWILRSMLESNELQ